MVTALNYNHVSGTVAGGTTLTPTNRNLGSSKIPTATIETGVDLTGLTDEGTVFFEECAVVNTRYSLRTSSNIILPQGSAVAFQRVEATGLITCAVSLVELETT